jgi:hypothetical protein
MYKAMGQTDAWRDGLFSHAAPLQAYQASLNQVNSGSLGALAVPRRTVKSRRRNVHTLPHYRAQSGMGNTVLGAFTEQQMRGLGHYAYQDGSLGDDATTTTTAIPGLPSNLVPATQADIATVTTAQESAKTTLTLWCAGLSLGVAYLFFTR